MQMFGSSLDLSFKKNEVERVLPEVIAFQLLPLFGLSLMVRFSRCFGFACFICFLFVLALLLGL